jgi:transcriptional regulator with XRE-family HTH domain
LFVVDCGSSGLKVSQARIAHWETGRANPAWEDPSLRLALSQALKMSINEIFLELGFLEIQIEDTPEASRIAQLVNKLPEESRDLVLRIVEEIVEHHTDWYGGVLFGTDPPKRTPQP